MKKFCLSVAFVVLALAGTSLAQASDKDAVMVPLENYLKGHATGDGEYFKKAFHTEGNLIWIRDGKYTTRSFAEYIAGASGKPPADEAQRKRRIGMVEVVGNAAVATIILDYPTVKFTDYMTLLKINGEWKIVNKTFFAEPKPAVEIKKN
ncbi:MAG: nuclear transport factor 2 family protein [Acidobacteria bacterium]|nr:nuclear transport factor 2 family protein [Acidobacteriota bacterium]MBP7476501.1 nuclear transport factor 2 family protein [Pyrinomonadaceae bacterium]MBP9110716.1 nuclear transport factor 2 family protein [Pyrinomonadaceae bacterium]